MPWELMLEVSLVAIRAFTAWRKMGLGDPLRSALESFLSERMVSGIVLTRAAVEASAALWYLSAKVDAVVDSKMVGDADEYLMKLAMGTATGWPETDTSTDVLTMPRPIKIRAFLKQVEKDIEGSSHQYGVSGERVVTPWLIALHCCPSEQRSLHHKLWIKSFIGR
jgi:hypothetical protein